MIEAYYLSEKSTSKIELEMLANAKIEGLMSVTFEKNDFGIKVTYQTRNHLITLCDKFSTGKFGKNDLKLLIKHVCMLDKNLSSHLLSIKKISMKSNTIFFSESEQKYYFIYLPFEENRINYNLLDLLRELAFEQPKLLSKPSLKLLRSSVFTLEKFADSIDEVNNHFSILRKTRKPFKFHSFSNSKKRPCIIDKNNATHSYPLYFEINSIGSGDENNIVIQESGVNSYHAIISIESHKFMLNDLGSNTGTYVNDIKISAAHPLDTGDIIRLGSKEFIFIR